MVGVEPRVSRRTALAAGTGLTAAALAGCGARTLADADHAGDARSDDPDLRLLRLAVDREESLRAELRVTSRRHPTLRGDLERGDAVHGRHVALLVRSLPSKESRLGVAVPPRARNAADAARDLARSERRLATAHARAALDARSGPFARVLAGMAAAAEQQAHVLDGLAVSGRHRRG
jgi:hypothetical protein